MNLPKDKFMLLSYINTQLRDNYTSLDDLCKSIDVDSSMIMNSLSDIGYSYSYEENRFK